MNRRSYNMGMTRGVIPTERGFLMWTEALSAVIAGILTILVSELRRRRIERLELEEMRSSADPPPPGREDCRTCFFFKEFRRRLREDDTRRIKLEKKN